MPMHLLRRSSLGLFKPLVLSRALAALLLLVMAAAACSGNPEKRKQAFFESGNRYFEAAKYPEAVIEYQNAIQLDPKFAEARLKLAETYEKAGDVPRAFGQVIRAADLLPNDFDLQVRAGNYLLRARQFEDARARADAVLEKDPGNAEAHVLRGYALSGLRDLDGAVKELEEAIQLDPGEASSHAVLGAMELARGQHAEAETALKRAVALSPEWAGAHLALSNYYVQTGNQAEAERSLKAALEAEPEDPFANRSMAAFLMAAGRPADAEPYLKRIAAASPPGVLSLADYYVATGRTAEAITELRKIRNRPEVTLAADERLVRALAASGERDEANALADALIKQNPKNSVALLAKAQLLMQEGKREEALAQVRASVEANPNSAQAQFFLGRLYAARGDIPAAQAAFTHVLKLNPRAAAAQVELANLHIQTNRAEAVTTARQALATDPGSLQARLALVRGLMARRDPATEKELQSLLKTHPDQAAVHALLGAWRAIGRDLAGARAAFQRALDLDPHSLDALNGLNAVDLSAGSVDAAKARIDERLAKGETPGLLLAAARTAATAKDPASAERFLRRALELEPTLLPAYSMLGRLYFSQQRLADARREFAELASRQTMPVAALTMIGMIYQMEGNPDAAREQYEKAVALDPNAAVAANNLAWIYAQKGENLDVALQLARSAVAAAPNTPEISDTLGWILYLKNLPELAVPPLARAVELDPGQPAYHYHLGMAYARQGDTQRGRESLERALALKTDFPGADEARRALAELRNR
jgi:putative PEP-CTERM system TPR-repeat lipoprotein